MLAELELSEEVTGFHEEPQGPGNREKETPWRCGDRNQGVSGHIRSKSTMADQTRNQTTGTTDLTRIIKGMVAKSENGIVTIAPGIAKRMLDEINYERQRSVKQWRVQLVGHWITDGTWNPNVDAIRIAVLPDGSMVLINGQHRLHAFVDCGVAVKVELKLIPVQDMEEVRKLYGKMDLREGVRSDHELTKAAGIDEVVQIAPKTAEILVKAVAIIENGVEPDVRTSNNVRMKDFSYRSEKAIEWDREARDVQEVLDIAESALRNKLRRASTMAIMLYTLRHQREKALYFWRTLAENDALPKRDPRNTLHVDLLTRPLASGNRRQGIQQSAIAWNAWFAGRQLKIIKCITGAEITIAGTPLAKGGSR